MNNFRDDLSGRRFNSLYVRRVLDTGGSGKPARFECQCDCGNVVSVRASLIRTGKTRTCGRCATFTAGSRAAARALCNVWRSMIVRCYEVDKDDPWYKHYRGRGIRVCKKWYHDQLAFIRWAVNNGYRKGLQLDRIDNDSGYRPSNCRFVTAEKNINNRRVTPMVVYRSSKPRPFAVLVRKYGVVAHGTAFQRYFAMGWDIHSALTTPARQGNYK